MIQDLFESKFEFEPPSTAQLKTTIDGANVKMGCSAATIICVGAGATQYVPSLPSNPLSLLPRAEQSRVDSSSVALVDIEGLDGWGQGGRCERSALYDCAQGVSIER